MKPHLRIVAGLPVEVLQTRSSSSLSGRESLLAVARRRAGGRFGWERPEFRWEQGPTILTAEWLAQQQAKRRK